MCFTIITASYNCSDTLSGTIESVLSQPIDNLEYIIVDGCSTDGTVDIIKKFASMDSRVRWLSEHDQGIYDAMNKGWKMARLDSMILYIGTGDILLGLPDRSANFDKGAIVCGVVESDGRLFRPLCGTPLKYANTLHHQALMIPKKLHPTPPFDTQFKCYADFDFNQRLYKNGARFVYSEKLRTYFAPGGISSRKGRIELFRVIKKNFGLGSALLAIASTPFRQSCWQKTG